jgi:2,4-dienoyl-CoA reductase-like NADH-dependent reductase (Old Yellow Enzyme family)/thioredoxin reductase
MSASYPHIFQPGQIGTLKLKNRIIFNPCESHFATTEGEVTQRLIDYYVRRAEGGASLLVVHSAQACTKVDPNDTFAGSLRVDDNAHLPMLSELTEAVHRAGSKIAILVSTGGGASAMGFPYDRGREGTGEIQNVGVSNIESLVAKRKVRQLTVDEIRTIIELYGLAARRVMMAGFDAMYIHALNYLTAQFMSPLYNTRTDEYGGDFNRRMRFVLELIEACRRQVGPSFPLVIRMSIDECFPGARTLDETLKVVKMLEDAGINAIDASAGIYESMHMIIPPCYLPKGVLTDYAAAVKQVVKIPVITQGRLYNPEISDKTIADGKADFVALARGLLADPYWVKKLEEGREDDIRLCITCNRCIDRILKGLSIRCATNPTAGRESEFAETPSKAETPKKVVIVGAGPAGMEAARIAGLKGHQVTLMEKTGELAGGQYKLAANAPSKDEFMNLVKFYQRQFAKMKNVKVKLNSEATLKSISAEKPDVVVLATGAKALVPDIEGINRPNVFTNHDQLIWAEQVKGKVAVIGGGCAGAGTADRLSDQGKDVCIVEMLEECAIDEELITRLTLLHKFGEKKVNIMARHKVKKIPDAGVVAEDPDQKEVVIPADYVIVAFGAVAYNPLEEEIRKKFKNYFVIGDAVKPRKIMDAVSEGFFVGNRI